MSLLQIGKVQVWEFFVKFSVAFFFQERKLLKYYGIEGLENENSQHLDIETL